MFKKEASLEELEKLEAEDNARLKNVYGEIEGLKQKRSDILDRMVEDDLLASPEMSKCNAEIEKKSLEAEVLAARLKKYPKRKDYARGVEIEKIEIPKVEKMLSELAPLAEDAKKKAAPFLMACNKLFDYLRVFDDMVATKNLRLQGDFLDEGRGKLSGYAPSSTAAWKDPVVLDLEPILMALAYDDAILSAWMDKARTALSKRLEHMRDHAQRLKGESLPDPTWWYCPHCYSLENHKPKAGETCSKCGRPTA